MIFSRAMDMDDAGASPAPAAVRPAPAPPPGNGLFSQPLIPIGAALAVAVLTVISIRMGHSTTPVVLWVANAFAAGVWLKSGRGRSFDLSFGALMFGGVLVGELLADNGLATSVVLAMANLVEIFAAVVLIRRLEPSLKVNSVRSTLNVLAAVTGAALIGGVVGAAAFLGLRGVPYLQALQVWTLGHALGLLIILPMMLSLNRRALVELRSRGQLAETILLVGGACLFAYVLCLHVRAPVAFLMNPVLLIVAVRLRVWALSIVLLVVSICLMASIGAGPGPAATAGLPDSTRIILAQLMLAFAAVPYLIVAALIEERNRLWVQARAGLARAERASEAKSRLLANVAHEIKSPVAGIIGIGDLWSSGQLGPVSATQGEMATMLVKTARQVETLAHDLLDVARAEAGTVKVEPRPTEIVGLVEDVRRSAMLRPEARGVAIQVVAESPAMVALADSQRLRQVIDNLAVNALKYGASGQSLVLAVRSCALGVRIEVCDQGPGLSPEKQAQLFEPFNRLGLERTSIEGHGVGLALARRLVELQGGEIGVISAPGEGATFWVEIPAA
jgi:signal transduction histidine kinase